MQKVELVRAEIEAQPEAPGRDSGPLILGLGELISAGEDHQLFWIETVHGEHPMGPSDALEIKREWNAWVKNALQMTTLLSLPMDTQRAIIDSW